MGTDDSISGILQSQFQSPLYELVYKLLEQSLETNSTNTSSATSSSTPAASTGPQAASSTSTPSSGSFASLINSAAEKYGVNPSLVSAVIKAESNYNPSAVSSAGALGLMQLMPGTAQGLGVTNPLDPQQNIDGGVRFLSQLLTHYGGNVRLAVAAYNAGPGAVDSYHGIPPYAETQTYVQRVLDYMNSGEGWSA